jgi:hypothetical protein
MLTNDQMWRWFLVLVGALLLAAVLSGCGFGSAPNEPVRADVHMTADGWACRNCNKLIPIDANDRPLNPEDLDE